MKQPTVGDILRRLDGIAPFETAEGFDNAGLLIGDPDRSVTAVVLTLDLSEQTVKEAADMGAELIITHHPVIFHPLRRIHYQTPFGRMLAGLMASGISVISAHTNWDKAPGGVGDTLAALLGLEDIHPLDDYVRLGTLPAPLSPAGLAERITEALGFCPRCYGDEHRTLRRVAVAGGSYGEGYEAALAAGADAFLTGEIKHHEILDAAAQGLVVYDGGHHATEQPAMPALEARLRAAAAEEGWQIQTRLSMAPPFAGATHM
jgi:dinuclear metal center YbgI/SA1388 family protein